MTSVLIVDDEPKVLNALQRCLRQVDIESDVYVSAKDALKSLLHKDYDCIISDYKMPEMDGLEFLEMASEVASDVPRLLLSGHADFDVLVQAINNCGVDSFLSKPWLNAVLVEKVMDSIELRKTQKNQLVETHEIQEQILVASLRQVENLPCETRTRSIHASFLFKPLKKLSGDIVDYELSDTEFNFAVIDTAGHGTAAAMESYALQKQLDLSEGLNPKEFVEDINNRYTTGEEARLFTMTIGNINFEKDTLSLCQAGHPNVYLVRESNGITIDRLGHAGLPIGYLKNESYDVHNVALKNNDYLVAFSENFTEEDAESLESIFSLMPYGNFESMKSVLARWCEETVQTDDISAVFLCYKPDLNGD